MTAFAPAKVNLALHVLGRRSDRFHDLDTVVVFCGVGDRLDVAPSASFRLDVEGPAAGHAPSGEDNLVARAAHSLARAVGRAPSVAIRLRKCLPAGAGFGGGSADAAAALHALNRLWRCGLDTAELARIGGELGADIPMALHATALRARGTGDRIEALPGLPPLHLVLCWPDAPVATRDVFAALAAERRTPLADPPDPADEGALLSWLAASRNDLQAAAVEACPAIGEALSLLLSRTDDCRLARMSGSGSGCFGIYGSAEKAAAARAAIRAARPHWWVAAAAAA